MSKFRQGCSCLLFSPSVSTVDSSDFSSSWTEAERFSLQRRPSLAGGWLAGMIFCQLTFLYSHIWCSHSPKLASKEGSFSALGWSRSSLNWTHFLSSVSPVMISKKWLVMQDVKCQFSTSSKSLGQLLLLMPPLSQNWGWNGNRKTISIALLQHLSLSRWDAVALLFMMGVAEESHQMLQYGMWDRH